MNFNINNANIKDIKADLEIIIVIDKNLKHKSVKDKKLLKKAGFSGSQDEVCHLVEKKRLYVGAETLKGRGIRPAVATAIRSLIGKKTYKTIKIATYVSHPRCSASIRAMVEGLVLGSYTFNQYKSKKVKCPVKNVEISLEGYEAHEITMEVAARALNNGVIAAEATNFTRDIVNTTPDDCYPEIMANIAEELAKENKLKCKILKPKELKKEKMETLLAVARASRHKPRVIHLSHKPKNPKAVITLVGKGLTYDSGGLSLKPADYMVTMKSDKSGGSAVLGLMKAISEMNLPVEVHGFVGAVENMIGGDAYKPDDVLVSKNGKTIEIRNTDAEGRLVLADTLSYAQQEVKADYLFDFATLTGACVVGVGHYTSGVLGFNEEVKTMVTKQAKISGELATALDFNPYLHKTIKSSIADVCNISNTRYGGAITAGQFLSEFIDEEHKEKWAHIDIAGPAFVEHTWGENPHGASGAGVRMMLRLIEGLARKKESH
ncbi:leucyl aminopeptidase [Sulfurovum sp. NBC37-1]|uniref:leucyl aminopeptidase n=1 Tax=Sulfurovum sp. (strain NBC37-1) TaxID=387093 RepID=UPI000158775D|nr:leucyl aminopeptidase [Sulfurovum sp. NBC37-1]BAF71610.1 leucyl aminopeptidase [Sulfurovum sp. NBC37-1]